jgi:hypothetical protein
VITCALSQLISRVEHANQDKHRETRALIVARQRGPGEKDISEEIVARDVEMFDVSNEEELELRNSVETDILESLNYSMMTSRYERVVEAHPETFEWIFRSSSRGQAQWNSFPDWLQTSASQGVYWVSGKAGSGKSTLMKHILDDAKTYEYLAAWGQGTPVCIASFFFWSSGTDEQKSQAGLFRALLYQVLEQHPELIPQVLPELWAKTYSRLLDSKTGPRAVSWSLQRLMSSFNMLVQQTAIPLKICFLIDGLDEFNGDHEEIVELFKNITYRNNIKVCLSSRPWVVFEDSFWDCPTLRLQHLTRPDIEQFVTDTFVHNNPFCKLKAREPKLASALISEIVEKADGVFLWVRIVVKSLLNGIRNRDDITILQERLRSLPRELEPLYRHLLGLIEPVYLHWASKAFQIIRAIHEIDQLDIAEGQRILTMGIFNLAIDESITLENSQDIDIDGMGPVYQNIAAQLTARCAGMLEVAGFSKHLPVTGGSQIVYLHTTTREFLEKDENWSHLLKHTAKADFNPHLSIMKAAFLKLRINLRNYQPDFESNKPLPDDFKEWIRIVMVYASYANADIRTRKAQTAILDRLDGLVTSVARPTLHWANDILPFEQLGPKLSFLDFTTLYNLNGYVHEKLSDLPNSACNEVASSLLYLLLASEDWLSEFRLPHPRTEMVSLLLQLGADPNRLYRYGNAWENILWYIRRAGKRPSNSRGSRLILPYARAMKLFIKAGANYQTRIFQNGDTFSVPEIVKSYLMPQYPVEATELLEELQNASTPAEFEGYGEDQGSRKKHDMAYEVPSTSRKRRRLSI